MTNQCAILIPYARNIREEDQGIGITGHGAGRRHLIGIHVVVLAVKAKREARDHRHCMALPQSEDPLWIGGADLADKTQIRISLLARAKRGTIAAAHPHRWLSQPGKGSYELLIDPAGQH